MSYCFYLFYFRRKKKVTRKKSNCNQDLSYSKDGGKPKAFVLSFIVFTSISGIALRRGMEVSVAAPN
jgi:hypothetical protein